MDNVLNFYEVLNMQISPSPWIANDLTCHLSHSTRLGAADLVHLVPKILLLENYSNLYTSIIVVLGRPNPTCAPHRAMDGQIKVGVMLLVFPVPLEREIG